MPFSFQQHIANGSTSVFSAAQIDGYLSLSHLYVYVNDVLKTAGTHYTLQSSPSLQITFQPAHIPANGQAVRIQRLTPTTVAGREVDFEDGSVLTASDLDRSALQLLFIAQESEDLGSGALGKNFDQLSWNAESLPISNAVIGADPTSVATKGYVDTLALYGAAPVAPQAWSFSGDGVQSTFTLSPVANATDPNTFIVEVDGTLLRPTTDYTIPSTSTLVFDAGAVPASGTDNIKVRNFGVSRNLNDSVSTGMIQGNAVTLGKLQQLPASRLLGRDASGAGNVQALSAGNGMTFTNSGAFGLRDILNLKDFGVVADGVTDDTTAFAAAIAAQQASGKTLVGVAGGNANLASWSRITTSSPFYFDGNHMTVTCGNPTSVEFIDCQNDFDIRNTDFQQWFRVLDCQKTTNRIKLGIFSNNIMYGRRKINPSTGSTISNQSYQVNIEPYFDDLIIDGNTIENSGNRGIHVGTQDPGYQQDTLYRRCRISNNRIINVNPGGGGPGSVYGCLHQGYLVEYIGNLLDGVNGNPVALGSLYGNGAYGLYCKAAYAIVRDNQLKNIGNTTGILLQNETHAISTKSARAIIENNVIDGVGNPAPGIAGVAIADDQSPCFRVINNQIFNSGGGIYAGGLQVGGGSVVSGNRIKMGDRIAAYPGIIAASATAPGNAHLIIGNQIEADPGHTNAVSAGIRVDTYVDVQGHTYVYGNSIRNLPGAGCASADGTFNYPLRNVWYVNNKIINCSTGISLGIDVSLGANNIYVEGNWLEGNTVALIASSQDGATIRDNYGYVTRNTGKATAIASGATVTHGLIGTPELVFVTPLSSGVTDVTVTNLTSTTFVINFGGGGTKDFAWDAQHARYNGRA